LRGCSCTRWTACSPTLRARRDEWIAAGVVEQLTDEALAAFDRIIGLDLDEVALDGSVHKAPHGGEGTGPNPTVEPRWVGSVRRLGASPHPIGWVIDGANRNDVAMLEPTSTRSRPPACSPTSAPCTSIGLPLRRGPRPALRPSHRTVRATAPGTKVPGVKKQPLRLGLRWIVEATNKWWSNYGQLRRNTDRRTRHRHAAHCLATTVLIIGRLIDWRDRWNRT
jgi:hypothetical protein